MPFVVIQTILLFALLAAYFIPFGSLGGNLPAWAASFGKYIVWAGLILTASAIASLGRATRVSPAPGTTQLVERGVYKYLRHPMYTSAIIVSVGMAVSAPRPTVIIAALSVIIFYVIKARYEEGLLIAHFPDYEAYRKRTLGVLFTK